MRLLILADFLDPERPAGSARVAWDMSRGLASRGHECFVVAGLDKPRPALHQGSLHAAWFEHGNREKFAPLRILRMRRSARRSIRELIAGRALDVVVAHQPLVSRLTEAVSELSKVPFVYVFHSPWHREFELEHRIGSAHGVVGRIGARMRRGMEQRALGRAAMIVTLSSYMWHEALRWHSIDEKAWHMIPGGADLDRFSPGDRDPELRTRLGLPDRMRLVVTIRRLTPRMGLDVLLRAFLRVATEFPDTALCIGGTGPLQGELEAEVVSAACRGRVFLLGHVPEAELAPLLREAALFVLPSRELEGFGLAMLESLACGTPCLATPVGGVGEVLDGLVGAFMSRSPSEEDLANGLRHWLADDRRREEYGVAAARHVRDKFGLERMLDGWEDVLGGVLRQGNSVNGG